MKNTKSTTPGTSGDSITLDPSNGSCVSVVDTGRERSYIPLHGNSTYVIDQGPNSIYIKRAPCDLSSLNATFGAIDKVRLAENGTHHASSSLRLHDCTRDTPHLDRHGVLGWTSEQGSELCRRPDYEPVGPPTVDRSKSTTIFRVGPYGRISHAYKWEGDVTYLTDGWSSEMGVPMPGALGSEDRWKPIGF